MPLFALLLPTCYYWAVLLLLPIRGADREVLLLLVLSLVVNLAETSAFRPALFYGAFS